MICSDSDEQTKCSTTDENEKSENEVESEENVSSDANDVNEAKDSNGGQYDLNLIIECYLEMTSNAIVIAITAECSIS